MLLASVLGVKPGRGIPLGCIVMVPSLKTNDARPCQHEKGNGYKYCTILNFLSTHQLYECGDLLFTFSD